MEDQYYKVLVNKCPFMTYGQYDSTDYLGIVQNCNNQIVSIYVYNLIPEKEMRKLFLSMGKTWWEESNRKLPINMFLRGQFKIFQPYMRTFVKKEWIHICGPMTSLHENITKRIKRRQITVEMLD